MILLIAVDMIYRLTDPNDPGCLLWSDGAGAVVLEGGAQAFQHASGWGILAGGTFERQREGGNYSKTINADRLGAPTRETLARLAAGSANLFSCYRAKRKRQVRQTDSPGMVKTVRLSIT